ncbi:MAG: hypothetical protein CML68_03960 [Rhodobacteraceae bacterium]|nr:hypothetical protein [Paracoccaceae bacterium]
MTEQTIYMHVGAGKTGSTYLQSALANARRSLAALGIDYPLEPRAETRARLGRVTSGNLRPTDRLSETLDRYPGARDSQTLLWSNETLHLTLTQPDRPIAASIREAFPDARLKVLYYIRDPLDHAVSSYVQVVKRNGFTDDLAAFLRRYDGPERLLMLDEVVRGLEGELTILNYSRHRDDLKATFETWLGLDPGAIAEPDMPVVNRSLTRGELELQRAFNAHLGILSSQVISDPLCEYLPDIQPEQPALARADLAAFLDRMTTSLADPRLEALIPEGEGYQLPTLDAVADRFPDPAAEGTFAFSSAQLDLLARALSIPISQRTPELALKRNERRKQATEGPRKTQGE